MRILKGFVVDDATQEVRAIVDVRVCESRYHAHPVPALWQAHWVTGPIDYCDRCMAAMDGVAAALAVHVHREPIALPRVPTSGEARRGIELEGKI